MLNHEELPPILAAKEAQLARDLESIRTRYGIELVISGPLSPEEVEVFQSANLYLLPGVRGEFPIFEKAIIARAMAMELSKYPTPYIEHTGVKKIRVFRGLKKGPKKMDEAYGLADLEDPERTVYLSTREGFMQVGRGVHHELSHHGDDVVAAGTEVEFDDLWADQVKNYVGIHNPVISYIASLPMPHFSGVSDDVEYVEDSREDRALMVEEIMNRRPWLRINILEGDIPIKAAWTLNALCERSGGLMDTNFFLDLFAGRVGEDYWLQREAAAA